MLSSYICSTLMSVCAMKGIPTVPMPQWGNDLTYYLTPFYCLVNWDMHSPGSARRGTDLPSGRLLYIHTYILINTCQKPWWNWYLTSVVNFTEVRRAQLAKSTLITSMLVPPWDLFRFFKVCSDAQEREREREREVCVKQREATGHIQSLVKLQPWFLSLWWKTYPWA